MMSAKKLSNDERLEVNIAISRKKFNQVQIAETCHINDSEQKTCELTVWRYPLLGRLRRFSPTSPRFEGDDGVFRRHLLILREMTVFFADIFFLSNFYG